MDQLVCFWGASASVYKGLEGGGWPAKGGAPGESYSLSILVGLGLEGGVLLPVGVGLLLRASSRPAGPPPWILYIRRQGAP